MFCCDGAFTGFLRNDYSLGCALLNSSLGQNDRHFKEQ